MAIDDIVNGISGDNAVLDYQPAAGVEADIRSTGIKTDTAGQTLYDGTNLSLNQSTAQGVANGGKPILGMQITNTRYIRVGAMGAGVKSSYTAIVINV